MGVADGMPSQEKKEKVTQLKKWFEKMDSLLVLHYKGLKVSEANELRGILAQYDVDLRVLKNTLTRIALTGTPQEGLIPLIDGPAAVVFMRDDPAAVAKSINEFARGRQDLYFQGGLLQGKILDGKQVDTLATLPAREVLFGQLLGQVAAPLSGVVGVTAGPLRKFLGVLQALAAQKESEPAAV